jgi:hypothetical protein
MAKTTKKEMIKGLFADCSDLFYTVDAFIGY